MTNIKIGSRQSELAVIQAKICADIIEKTNTDTKTTIKTYKTKGDRILNVPLYKSGGKGLFVKEINQALRTGEIDLAVHSLKDMPMHTPEDLPILALVERKNPFDAIIFNTDRVPKEKVTFEYLFNNKDDLLVGTSSLRRRFQLLDLNPNLRTVSLRGNIHTRLKKMKDEKMDAIILADAGIVRANLKYLPHLVFDENQMIPSAGQGVLALQGRTDFNKNILKGLDDQRSRISSMTERSFIRELGAGCSSPVACYCKVKENKVKIWGLYAKINDDYELVEMKKKIVEGIVDESVDLAKSLAREVEIK